MNPLQMDANQLADFIRKSPYFDAAWYANEYSDIEYHSDGNPDPAYHYANYGYKENRLPSLLFDGNLYAKHANVYDVNPLAHYLANGGCGDYVLRQRFNEVLLKVSLNLPLTQCERILWLEKSYQEHFHSSINLAAFNACSFTDKLFYLLAYYTHEEMAKFLDPANRYDYVRSNYGFSHEETYDVAKVFDSVEQIDISNLPHRYFIKCTGLEETVTVTNSQNKSVPLETIKEICAQLLAQGSANLNSPYLNNIEGLKPHLVFLTYKGDVQAEQAGRAITEIENEVDSHEPTEVSFYCCNGHVSFLSTTSKPNAITVFDRDFNMLPTAFVTASGEVKNVSEQVVKPVMLETLIAKAEALSKQHPFLKVSFNLYKKDFVLNSISFVPDFAYFTLLNNYDQALGYKLDISCLKQK